MPPKRTRGLGRRTQQPAPEEPTQEATLPATMSVQSGQAEANDAQVDKPAVRRSKRLNKAPQQSVEPVAPKIKKDTKKDKKKPDDEVPAAAEPLAVNTTTTTAAADEDSKDKPPPPTPTTHPLPSDILRTDESSSSSTNRDWREAGGEQKLVRELKNKNKLLDKLIEENRQLRASAGPLKLEVYKLKKRVAELEENERKREAEEELKCERRKRVRIEAEKAASKDVVVLDDDDDDKDI